MSVQGKYLKINVNTFAKMKNNSEKIACLTAYDYTSAKILDKAGIEIILIGDSLGMVCNGYDTTLPVTVDEIIYHSKAVRKGAENAFLVADMPFGSYHQSIEDGVNNCIRVIKETGVNAVKLEGGERIAPLIEKLVGCGVNVMGHIGLMPQAINTMGGYKIFGRDGSDELLKDAKALENAGVFATVVEGTTSATAEIISKSVKYPIIGIGAGNGCDGQILVFHDIFGLFEDFKPKFVKRYANCAEIITNAAKNYITEVKSGAFPDKDHSFE